MQNTNTLIIAAMALTAVLAAFIFWGGNTPASAPAESAGFVVVEENDFDLGKVPIRGGLVKRSYVLENKGEEAVKIEKVSTSCMCTEAFLTSAAGKTGPFGMSGHTGGNYKAGVEIGVGEKVILEAVFDPLAHGPEATGKIIREIYLETNSLNSPFVTLSFKGEVVKELPRVAGPSLYISRTEHDFGVVKQSGGIVSADFEVINNGDKMAIIESLPTSCGCTTAKISKKEIPPGEKAVITVSFDSNFHAEPEGRFFRTVSVVGNVNPDPELKIYAEIDEDLGPEYYKVK